jgi:hypothetical protein
MVLLPTNLSILTASFTFSSELAEFLIALKWMYARINLKDLGELQGRYALHLFEIALSYRSLAGRGGNRSEAWYFEWDFPDEIRRVMGVAKDAYKDNHVLLGKDIETIFITDSDARHIKKKHGQGEARRGQEDITPEDFALIPLVRNEFDTATHDGTDALGNKKILFVKRVNGNVYTASVERGNDQIGVITLLL